MSTASEPFRTGICRETDVPDIERRDGPSASLTGLGQSMDQLIRCGLRLRIHITHSRYEERTLRELLKSQVSERVLDGIDFGVKVDRLVVLCESSLEWMSLSLISSDCHDVVAIDYRGGNPGVRYRFCRLGYSI